MHTPDLPTRGPETSATVRVRYWAGARAAARVDEERVTVPASVGALLAHLGGLHPELVDVLPVCSILVEGRASDAEVALPDGAVVEVLPPFAGG